MARTALSYPKITTKNPQQPRVGGKGLTPAGVRARRAAQGAVLVSGDPREGTRGEGRVVVEVAGGITVYPARPAGDRGRAGGYETGQPRHAEAGTGAGLT